MNIKNMLNDGMLKQIEEMGKNFKILEDHLITQQENMVEFEHYLKEIQSRLKNIENKLK